MLDNAIAHVLHELNVPPLSAEADELRAYLRETAADMVRDFGVSPESIHVRIVGDEPVLDSTELPDDHRGR